MGQVACDTSWSPRPSCRPSQTTRTVGWTAA